MSWTVLAVICLGACMVWELDEQQIIKKYKKKKRIEQQRKK